MCRRGFSSCKIVPLLTTQVVTPNIGPRDKVQENVAYHTIIISCDWNIWTKSKKRHDVNLEALHFSSVFFQIPKFITVNARKCCLEANLYIYTCIEKKLWKFGAKMTPSHVSRSFNKTRVIRWPWPIRSRVLYEAVELLHLSVGLVESLFTSLYCAP